MLYSHNQVQQVQNQHYIPGKQKIPIIIIITVPDVYTSNNQTQHDLRSPPASDPFILSRTHKQTSDYPLFNSLSSLLERVAFTR